jgi:catechol 2,3-dioxygenase-like lactoylglutathione lyase family enzyme
MPGSAGPESTLVLHVRDVQRASSWYRLVLQFRLESESLGLNGVPVEAHLRRPGGPALVLMRSDGPPAQAVCDQTLSLVLSDDLGHVAERAAAARDTLYPTPTDRGARRLRRLLHDPDGYVLIVLQASALPW